MTRSPMSCDQFADALADYLERMADTDTVARVERHAVSCAECGPLLALRIEAVSLPELVPSRDLWPEIAARIETPVVEFPGTMVRSDGLTSQRTRSRVWLGLAAAGLIAVTATITRQVSQVPPVAAPAPVRVAQVTPPAVVPAPTSSMTVPATSSTSSVHAAAEAQPVSKTIQPAAKPQSRLVANRAAATTPEAAAEQTYDREISRLRAVVSRRRGQLDSGTVATIEKNLVVIDDAIKQCKVALRKDPASRFLMESLNDAMDTKVQLLRTAATLPTKS